MTYKPDYHLDSERRKIVIKNGETNEDILKYISTFIPVIGQCISIQSNNSDTTSVYGVESITDVITIGDGWMNSETHVFVAKVTDF